MTADAFVGKWSKVDLTERSAAQAHFLDLCELVGHPKPQEADPKGEWFTFERGASKQSGGDGWADDWKKDFFGWEYQGRHKDLDAAYDQLLDYRADLNNPPLLVVCDMDIIRIRTNFNNAPTRTHEITLATLAEPRSLEILEAVFHAPDKLRPGVTSEAITEKASGHLGIMTKTQTTIVALLLGSLCVNVAGAPTPFSGGWKQKDFIITFWCPPPATDEALARAAAEGYELTWMPAEGLDVAARHHLRAMLTNDLLKPEVLDDPDRRAQLDALIERVKKHPALEAYFLTDEPGAGAFPGLGRLVAYLRERDPAHLAYINLFPTYASEQQLGVSAEAAERARVIYPTNFAGVGTDDKTVLRYREHVQRFLQTVKPGLLSYDHYHFLKRKSDGSPNDGTQYFLNIALIRLAAQQAGVPFLNIIQAGDLEKAWRLPNAEEMRWLVYTTLAYGGRGISYFTYWGASGGLYVDGKPSPLVKPVAALNVEIAKLGPPLMELESVAVYHTAPLPYGTEAIPASSPVQVAGPGQFVLGLFGKADRPSAFMIVNRDYEHGAEAVLRIRLPGSQLQELDRTSGKWTRSRPLGRDRTVKAQLDPGDGRLFRVTGTPRDGEKQRGAESAPRFRLAGRR